MSTLDTSFSWQVQAPTRHAPDPYGDDHVLAVGDFEAQIHVNRNAVAVTVYSEPQRPQDPTTGTIYGRSCAVSLYIACEETTEARAAAVVEAKRICEEAIVMLRDGVSAMDVYERSGSAKWWAEWRAKYGSALGAPAAMPSEPVEMRDELLERISCAGALSLMTDDGQVIANPQEVRTLVSRLLAEPLDHAAFRALAERWLKRGPGEWSAALKAFESTVDACARELLALCSAPVACSPAKDIGVGTPAHYHDHHDCGERRTDGGKQVYRISGHSLWALASTMDDDDNHDTALLARGVLAFFGNREPNECDVARSATRELDWADDSITCVACGAVQHPQYNCPRDDAAIDPDAICDVCKHPRRLHTDGTFGQRACVVPSCECRLFTRPD